MSVTYNNIRLGFETGARPVWLQQEAKEQRDKMFLEVIDEMREAGQANWEWDDYELAYGIKCGRISLPERANDAIRRHGFVQRP